MGYREPMIISESEPFIVGDLTVYPDRLRHRATKCNFRDIQHLDWYWVSQTTSFLNTQSVSLTIHVRGLKRPISISKTTMYVVPKLVAAYNYIASETFQTRLLQYTDQLEEHGSFTYQRCTFYSDGRIQGNGNIFNLADANYEPFSMRIKQPGFFAPRLNIDLRRDKDVIVSILTYILSHPRDPSQISSAAIGRKKARYAADAFLVDAISMLAKIASADGDVSAAEISAVKDIAENALRLSAEQTKQTARIFQEACESPQSFEFYAHRLFESNRKNLDLLRSVLDLLFSVASADNVLSAEEELLLYEAESIFGLHGVAFASYRSSRERRRRAQKQAVESMDVEYLRILGLSGSPTPTEIKARYRRLVMQYHPDRVHHLGEDFRLEAEKHMKKINNAYAHFCKKYDI